MIPSLADSLTWHEPDEIVQTNTTTCSDRHLTVTLQAWHNILDSLFADDLHEHFFFIQSLIN